ncbi:GEVED domain-containing protein [Pontibacter saemangeumensis]
MWCAVDYWIVKIDASGNKVWDKSFGGSGFDKLTAIVVTPEGGFLLAGYSDSPISGDKTQDNHVDDICLEGDCPDDYWVVKIDGSGNKLWDKTFGGHDFEDLEAIVTTPDGGYLLGGTSRSGISGNKSEASKGGYSDYWVVKIDGSGNKVWDKTFGGSNYDRLSTIVATLDGGYLLGGWSDSGISGDKSDASRGSEDYWVVKIDGSGDQEWDKTFGGSNYDRLLSMVATLDGGYILGGGSSSPISGDKSEASRGGDYEYGGNDYWIVKINGSGIKLWDKTFGGDDDEDFTAVVAAWDGGFLLGGSSRSGISGDKSEASKSFIDYWVVKMTDNPYCVPAMANGCADDHYIAYFSFADLYYNALGQGCRNNNSYTDFYPFDDKLNQSYYEATVKPGQSYPISLKSESYYGAVSEEQAYGVWIDYNDDKDFDDPGEFVYGSPAVGADFSGTVTIPADASLGVRRMRVRSRPEGVFTASESCTAGSYGETQDYTIAIGYCAPFPASTNNNGSYIDNFSFHTLVNNNSGYDAPGYTIYEPTGTLTTTVTKGQGYSLSVQSGPVAQAFGVWIDFNNDLDFDDEGELVYASPVTGEDYIDEGYLVSPSVSTDPFTGTVVIPASATAGPLRMRVRSNSFPFRGVGGACAEYDSDPVGPDSDSFLYGETEDYTITIEEPEVEPPTLASFSPRRGLPGVTVRLSGTALATTTSVRFNGVEAVFSVLSDTQLEAVVPATATTGRITVTTDGGEATSDRDFRVLRPSIYVFAPWRGYEGSKVFIVGEYLATASEVRFNGVPTSDISVYNDHLLKVTVPEGATTGRITVLLAGGGQVVSSFSYTVLHSADRAEKITEVIAATTAERAVAYPNPFMEGVTISVSMQEEEPVSLVVYSASGQKVRELRFGRLSAGQHELKWDGTDSNGKPVSRGLYLYQVAGNGKIASGKLLKEK